MVGRILIRHFGDGGREESFDFEGYDKVAKERGVSWSVASI